jgi:hypothetical protein
MAGCANPLKVNSVLNPDYSGRQYGKILVVADGSGVDFQTKMESRVAAILKEKAPDLTFVAAHQKVATPFSRRKLFDVAKTEKLQARLVLVSTHPRYKGADQTPEAIAKGIPSEKQSMLGVQATLVDVSTNKHVWMALISLPAPEGKTEETYDLLAAAVAEKVLLAKILAIE